MKLLFDQNLSFKLCKILSADFPGSSHVRLLGLDRASDLDVWHFAATHGYVLVSKDGDFSDISMLLGPPPKLIWIRSGNTPSLAIANRILGAMAEIQEFHLDESSFLELH